MTTTHFTTRLLPPGTAALGDFGVCFGRNPPPPPPDLDSVEVRLFQAEEVGRRASISGGQDQREDQRPGRGGTRDSQLELQQLIEPH